MVYLTLLFVAFTAVFFARTRAGLSYRSVGEHPQAAATLGIHVIGIKYLSCVICGALCPASAALTSPPATRAPTPTALSPGRGFIALAAVHLRQMERGRRFCWPCLFFGFCDALQIQSSGLRHCHPLSVLPDDSISCHSSGPEPDRHEAGRPAGKWSALSPRTAIKR